jgi:hypothetical protein
MPVVVVKIRKSRRREEGRPDANIPGGRPREADSDSPCDLCLGICNGQVLLKEEN